MSEIIREQDRVIVKPGKDVVASMVSAFSEELMPLIQSSPAELIIDMEGVEMVDSLGMGVLIATHNQLGKKGGQLSIINLSQDIFKAFQTMRLQHHFSVKACPPETP